MQRCENDPTGRCQRTLAASSNPGAGVVIQDKVVLFKALWKDKTDCFGAVFKGVLLRSRVLEIWLCFLKHVKKDKADTGFPMT